MARSIEQRGEAVRAGRHPQVPGAGPLDPGASVAPGVAIDLDLTALLGRVLAGRHAEGKTWGQLLIEGWIVDALEGDPKAIQDILDRIEKRRLAAATAGEAAPPIDDETAGKVLEVLCGSGEETTGD